MTRNDYRCQRPSRATSNTRRYARETERRSKSRIVTHRRPRRRGTVFGNDSRFNRRPDPKSPGAIRCRVFHTKLSEAAVQYMNNQVNEWLDENDHIVVKSSSTTIGVFEGKQKEPHLILTIFY